MERNAEMFIRVYITPQGGVGGELPVPVPFRMGPSRGGYSREFVKAYCDACRSLGQTVRIEYGATPYRSLRKCRR